MMQRVPLGYFSLESFICCAKNGTRLIKSDRQLESEQQKKQCNPTLTNSSVKT